MRVCILTDSTETGSELTRSVRVAIPGVLTDIATGADKISGHGDFAIPDMIIADTNTTRDNTIAIAADIRRRLPDAYIVLVADDGKYAIDAFRVHVRGYIINPVTTDRIREEYQNWLVDREDHSEPSLADSKGLSIRRDREFEVYMDGEPVRFARNKSKKLLEYLIDHDGVMVSDDEILSALWDNETKSNKSYLRTLKSEIVSLFREGGCENAVIKHRGKIGIMTDRLHNPQH